MGTIIVYQLFVVWEYIKHVYLIGLKIISDSQIMCVCIYI